jgi:hypothetical protein
MKQERKRMAVNIVVPGLLEVNYEFYVLWRIYPMQERLRHRIGSFYVTHVPTMEQRGYERRF